MTAQEVTFFTLRENHIKEGRLVRFAFSRYGFLKGLCWLDRHNSATKYNNKELVGSNLFVIRLTLVK